MAISRSSAFHELILRIVVCHIRIAIDEPVDLRYGSGDDFINATLCAIGRRELPGSGGSCSF